MITHNLIERDIRITNARVYDLEESLVASGYPMIDKVVPREYNEADVKRAVKLANTPSGSGHSNFLVGILVSFDLTAPRYFWQQAQRYHWFNVVSSQSTMHRITKATIEGSMFTEATPQESIDLIRLYQKEDFGKLKGAIPEGLMLTARIATNYQQLRTMYHQRKDHRLPEWHLFCQWVEGLPMGKELITE